MTISQIKEGLHNGDFSSKLAELYGADAVAEQTERYLGAIRGFERRFGSPDINQDREIGIYSAPGRAEIGGNHTDHQRGRVLAAAIHLDVLGIAAPSGNPGVIELCSEGYADVSVSRDLPYDKQSPGALIRGILDYFDISGYKSGGLDIYMTSRVLEGSGLSSSAAFETLIGTVLSHEYNAGAVPVIEIAKAGRHAENNFMGKPSGLMDQTASAYGGFVYIDFYNDEPAVQTIRFDPHEAGYELCVVSTRSDHASLTADYASMPVEMKAVAARLGHEVLGFCDKAMFYKQLPAIRGEVGDRALQRAMHFFDENDRVLKQAGLLKSGQIKDFLSLVNASGLSSSMLLQNIYTADSSAAQPVSLALALSRAIMEEEDGACRVQYSGACRVHGGGFAGTILAFVPISLYKHYSAELDGCFGPGSCQKLAVRSAGAVRVI
ncbi:MAG: galactokinase [Clostridiales bacterium]|nr:galactokinase [Clostridiales bacterium]